MKDIEQTRYPFFYIGTVVRNDDPEKLGRIRAHVPSIKTETKWAYPAGFPGCGPGRGHFAVPPLQSNVTVGFLQGDADAPFYFCGPWAAPGSKTEIPRSAASEEPATVHQVHAIESDLFEIFINDRTKVLTIQSKDEQEMIEMDLKDRSLHLKARNWLIIEAAGISIKAPGGVVQIQGRKFMATGEPT